MVDFAIDSKTPQAGMGESAYSEFSKNSFASSPEAGSSSLQSIERLAIEKTAGEALASQQTALEKSLDPQGGKPASLQDVSLPPPDKLPGHDVACHKVDTEKVTNTFKGADQWLTVLEKESKQGKDGNRAISLKEEANLVLQTVKDSLDRIYDKCGGYPTDIQAKFNEIKERVEQFR